MDEKELLPGVSPISGTAPPAWGKWVPGQSGNPEGGKISKKYKAAIERALALMADKGDPDETRTKIALAHIARACAGDMAAIKEYADREDGKVANPIGGSDELGPVKVAYGWTEPEKKPE